MKSWSRAKRALWIVALCGCVPVFYVLSLGPAVLIVDKFDLYGRPAGIAAGVFYSPIERYASGHLANLEVQLLEKYLNLWAGAKPQDTPSLSEWGVKR